MNAQEYIESGIIEAYVLGMLSEPEKMEVEEMAEKFPEVNAALNEARNTMGSFAKAYSVQPKPEWKEDILKAALDARPSGKDVTVRDISDTYEKGERSSSGSSWAIAASIALLVSLGINVFQYLSLNGFKQELRATNIRLSELEQNHQTMVTNYKEVSGNLAVLTDPNTASFIMTGVQGRDASLRADVYWNPASEMVYLNVKNLPQAPVGKQYQLWALKDGKPIDMGVFDGRDPEKALKEMGKVPGAQAFAVTLEPSGGSVNPTMEEMYVYGTLATS